MRFAPAMLAIVASLVAPSARADAESPLTSVRIDAALDPVAHEARGQVIHRLRNTTSSPLRTLVFHLYLEAFRDDRSVFMRESRGSLRGVAVEGRGGETVERILVDGTDVLAHAARELVSGDTTQLRVDLPRPIAIGEEAEIRVDFRSHLPQLAARAGYVGDLHLLAQWYPKLAKLEPDGTWASFPYHGNGEFYADFARYEVTLRVPRGFAVEGTGRRVGVHASGRFVVHRFVADPVHDAAYAISPRLSTLERSCSGVALRVAYPPGFAAAAAEHAQATCFGLATFGRWFGAYPYPTLTVVVPPRGAAGGAGMEYPTAFLTDGPWFASRALPFASGAETTFHELAHQWFQGLVASDEDRYPVLDEGLASFAGYEALATYRGRREELYYESMRPFVARGDLPPPSLPSDRYTPYQYGASVYGRSTAVFETLARVHGRERILAALGRYARAQRFRHPRPPALIEAFREELGDAIAEQLDELLLRGLRIVTYVERGPRGSLVLHRDGPLAPPLDVQIREGARTRRMRWSGTRTLTLTRSRTHESFCVVVDPDRRNLLDPRRADDAACAEPRAPRVQNLVRIVLAALLRGIGS